MFKKFTYPVFDEAMPALDLETDMIIQEALVDLSKNRTTIVIAHRFATIKIQIE